MNTQEHYQSDLLFYFDGRPQELALYEDLFQAMSAAFPDACVGGRRAGRSTVSW